MNFSVPKNINVSAKSSWSHGGHKFEGTPLVHSLKLLGQDIEAYQVDVTTQNPKIFLLFKIPRGGGF
jgi:hypothetical protein